MIKTLQNKDITIATKIRSVFQASYAVEAKLLKAIDFPPLKRKLESYLESSNDFIGYYNNQELAGVIEIKSAGNLTHIQSLVVHPQFFRQGIARSLMDFILQSYDTKTFMVETGVDNGPAIGLYKSFDFVEVKQWDTDHGVRKLRMEK